MSAGAAATKFARNHGFTGSPSRWMFADGICIAALLMLVGLIWMPRAAGPIDLRWDASVYYLTGVSMAEGRGYRLLNEPGEIQAVQYPPLVPAIVALHQKALGTTDAFEVGRWLKVTWWAFFGAFAVLTFGFIRSFLPSGWAMLATAIPILHPDFYINASYASSELPFAMATAAFLFAYYRQQGRTRECLTAAAAILAFFSRTIGVGLFAAWFVDALLRKQFRTAAVRGIIAAACVLSWSAYIRRVENSAEYRSPAYSYQRAGYMFYNVSYGRNMAYIDPFRPELGTVSPSILAVRAAGTVPDLLERIGIAVTTKEGHWGLLRQNVKSRTGLDLLGPHGLRFVLNGLGLLTAAGLVVLLLGGDILIPAFLAAIVGAASLAPWPTQFFRYVAPVLPLFSLAFCCCIRTAILQSESLRLSWGRRAIRFACVVLVVGVLSVQAASFGIAHRHRFEVGTLKQRDREITYRHIWYGKPDIALDTALEWIAVHAAPTDVIAASMPQWAYLRTGLKSVMPPFEEPERAQALLDSVPVRYLVFENPSEHVNPAAFYTTQLIATTSDRWREVFADEDRYVTVYERIRSEH